jgi:hypothetical protein
MELVLLNLWFLCWIWSNIVSETCAASQNIEPSSQEWDLNRLPRVDNTIKRLRSSSLLVKQDTGRRQTKNTQHNTKMCYNPDKLHGIKWVFQSKLKMNCYRTVDKNSTTGVTSGAGTSHPSGASDFTPNCIGGGNRNTRRKPPTCLKSWTNFTT